MARTRLALYGGIATARRGPQGDGPTPFAFTSLGGVALSALALQSEIITLLGIAAGGVAITISGDTGYGYSLNGGGFVTTSGTANSGDTIQVEVNASANYNEGKGLILIVGDVVAPFSVTTLRAPFVADDIQVARMRHVGRR